MHVCRAAEVPKNKKAEKKIDTRLGPHSLRQNVLNSEWSRCLILSQQARRHACIQRKIRKDPAHLGNTREAKKKKEKRTNAHAPREG